MSDEIIQIKARPIPHVLGKIVAGFNQRVETGEQVNAGSIAMGSYVGKFSFDHEGTPVEVEVTTHIVGGGTSFRVLVPNNKDHVLHGRRFDTTPSPIFDFIRKDLLNADLTFEKDTNEDS